MSDFFHGWRRKAGCVALAMTLFLAGAWIRSLIREDNLHTPFFTLHTHCGTISWFDSQSVGWRWHTKEINSDNWTGFVGVWRRNKDAIAVPYWIFLLPAMMLSAYLIVWPGKPNAALPPQGSAADE
jgi:hypothetical protein